MNTQTMNNAALPDRDMKNNAVLFIVCLGTIISTYVGSCVNIALPNIMAALNFNMDSIVWVSLGYLLPFGSMLPLTGKLGDKYGAKNVYIIGLIIFSLGSTLSGLATSSSMIVVCRFFQGVGGGMLLPNAMIIVVANFTGRARAQALGIWSAMGAAGSAMGPTIGGYLIDLFNWRAIFFSITPLCVFGILMALLLVPKSERNRGIEIDFVGGLLLIVSIGALLIALNQGEKEGWFRSYYICTLFYVSAAAFILFILTELYLKTPLVDFALFKNINFTISNIVSAISFFTLFASMFLLPFFLKSTLNFSSIQAGVMMLPQTVTMVIVAPLGGRLSAIVGSRPPTFVGMVMAAYAFYLMNGINTHFGAHDFAIPLAIYGCGLGLTMSPLTSCAISTLPKDKIGAGSGIFNFSKMISGSIGIVFSQTMLTQREIFHSDIFSSYLKAGHTPAAIYQFVHMLNFQNAFIVPVDVSAAALKWTLGMDILPEQYDAFLKVLNDQLAQQSSVASFEDIYFIMALLCAAGIVLAAFIRTRT